MEYQRTTYARFDPRTGEVTTQNMPPSEPECLFWEIPWGVTANDLLVLDGVLYIPRPRPTEESFWEYDPLTDTWSDPRDPAEIRADLISKARIERDQLLSDTDKYMLPDYPISPEKRQQWTDYRQALRDLDTIMADPANPAWPEAPTE